MKNAVIVADDESNAWEFARRVSENIKREHRSSSGIPIIELEVKKFKDGEIGIHIAENVRKKDVYFIHDSSKAPSEWWVELLLVNDALKRASAESITDVLPYLKYSRQDRKDRPHVPISAKVLANTISLDANRVITTDLHCPQLQGFLDIPYDNLYSFPVAAEYIKKTTSLENLVVFSPDKTGVERAVAFAKKLGCPMAGFTYKERSAPGEIGKMIFVGDVKGKNVLVVDDMIDSGGTSIKVAEEILKNGATGLIIYATHPVFSDNADLKLSNVYKRIIVSNSIPIPPRGKVEIVDLSRLYAEVIYRAQRGESISELFL